MSAVTFIDSSGVGALVFLYKRLVTQGRDMVLVGLQGQPRDMLRLLRIDKTVSTFESLNAYVRVHAQLSAAETEVVGEMRGRFALAVLAFVHQRVYAPWPDPAVFQRGVVGEQTTRSQEQAFDSQRLR